MILAHDKLENNQGETHNVLFAATHVQKMTEEEFQEAIKADNEPRRKKGLAEKAVE